MAFHTDPMFDLPLSVPEDPYFRCLNGYVRGHGPSEISISPKKGVNAR
jgi:hypothetical protein